MGLLGDYWKTAYRINTDANLPAGGAYSRNLSGKDIFAANAINAQEEVLFTINWLDDITTTHVISYNGILWNIMCMDTFEGYKGNISLYCKLY